MPHFESNGATIHYRIEGDTGAPLVLLSNSLASNLSMWDLQVPALLAAGFRVLRYDTRGHGASSVPTGPYTVETLAADACGLLDHLGEARAHFCGLSLGGMTGQKFATLYPERLFSLVLCATAAYMGPPDLWAGRIKTVEEGGMQAVVDTTLSRWFTEANQQRLKTEVASIRAGILATPTAGYVGCGAAVRDMDQRESIRAISAPTLVMVGALDPATTVDSARLLNERINGSEMVIIRDTQHLFNVEEPREFNAALVDFLVRHR
ncbi:MAG: 3-oxoadipate enol-lactonase [Gammaproteobacteria bacterium]|nr:3-oxoadipate enol-lactonase [Gammaproteobacteria bacterium]